MVAVEQPAMATWERALVTGASASAGLGREFATQLATAGTDLVLVARSGPVLEEVAGELERDHGALAASDRSAAQPAAAPQRVRTKLRARTKSTISATAWWAGEQTPGSDTNPCGTPTYRVWRVGTPASVSRSA